MTTPIKTKTYFVQIFLIVLSTLCVLLGMLLSNKSVFFYPCVQLVQSGTESVLEVGPGQISLAHAGIFIGFLFAYLLFEFYSFKPALYTILNAALASGVAFIIIKVLQVYTLQPETSHTDQLISEFFQYNRRDLFATLLGFATGIPVTLILAASIKRLTHNYLMFIRFPIASLIGFGVFLAVSSYTSQLGALNIPTLIALGITPYSQFVSLIVASLIPLYVLRLLLSIFRGRAPKEKKGTHEMIKEEKKESGGFFKPAHEIVIPAQVTSDTPSIPAEQVQPYSESKNEFPAPPASA